MRLCPLPEHLLLVVIFQMVLALNMQMVGIGLLLLQLLILDWALERLRLPQELI